MFAFLFDFFDQTQILMKSKKIVGDLFLSPFESDKHPFPCLKIRVCPRKHGLAVRGEACKQLKLKDLGSIPAQTKWLFFSPRAKEVRKNGSSHNILHDSGIDETRNPLLRRLAVNLCKNKVWE